MLLDEDLDNPTILIFITEATPPSRSGTVPRFERMSLMLPYKRNVPPTLAPVAGLFTSIDCLGGFRFRS